MAIKYGRDGFGHGAPGGHAHASATRRSIDPKRRLLIIYLGILMFCVLMFVFHGLGMQRSLELLPEEQTLGTILAKQSLNGQFVVTIEVEVAIPGDPESSPRKFSDDVHVTQSSYDAVEVGDRLQVIYQLNQSRSALIVRELAMLNADAAAEEAYEVEFQAPPEP